MPKGHRLTEEQRERIYDLYTLNYERQEIAQQFGISVDHVGNVVRQQRRKREEKGSGNMAEVVVAGDKRNGRLVSRGKDKFEGTCLIGGKMKRRTFSASNAGAAKVQWEKWATTLRDEEEFLANIERRPVEEPAVRDDTPSEQELVIALAKAQEKIREMQDAVDFCERLEEAVLEGQPVDLWGVEYEPREKVQEAVQETQGDVAECQTAYVVWAMSGPRLYGVYESMERAIGDSDKLNEVASFLGSDGAFSVDEVAWR